MTTGLRHLERWRRILKYSECFLMLTEVVKQILKKPVQTMGWTNSGKDEVKYVYYSICIAEHSNELQMPLSGRSEPKHGQMFRKMKHEH